MKRLVAAEEVKSYVRYAAVDIHPSQPNLVEDRFHGMHYFHHILPTCRVAKDKNQKGVELSDKLNLTQCY